MRILGNRLKCLFLAGTLLAGSPSTYAAFKKAPVEVQTTLPAKTLTTAGNSVKAINAFTGIHLSARQQRQLTRKAIWAGFKQSFRRTPSGSSKSQLAALLLCLFLGSLGIHRFYLGYTVIGILQLLAFLLLPGIVLVAFLASTTATTFGLFPLLVLLAFSAWILVDLIRIITGDLQPKNSTYDKTL